MEIECQFGNFVLTKPACEAPKLFPVPKVSSQRPFSIAIAGVSALRRQARLPLRLLCRFSLRFRFGRAPQVFAASGLELPQ
jgi:hypothetical protein